MHFAYEMHAVQLKRLETNSCKLLAVCTCIEELINNVRGIGWLYTLCLSHMGDRELISAPGEIRRPFFIHEIVIVIIQLIRTTTHMIKSYH